MSDFWAGECDVNRKPESGYDQAFKNAGLTPRTHGHDLGYEEIFPNGYGVSVVCHRGSYGYKMGQWEMAVLHLPPDAKRRTLCCTTDITNDVEGFLSVADVLALVARVKALDITGKEVAV